MNAFIAAFTDELVKMAGDFPGMMSPTVKPAVKVASAGSTAAISSALEREAPSDRAGTIGAALGAVVAAPRVARLAQRYHQDPTKTIRRALGGTLSGSLPRKSLESAARAGLLGGAGVRLLGGAGLGYLLGKGVHAIASRDDAEKTAVSRQWVDHMIERGVLNLADKSAPEAAERIAKFKKHIDQSTTSGRNMNRIARILVGDKKTEDALQFATRKVDDPRLNAEAAFHRAFREQTGIGGPYVGKKTIREGRFRSRKTAAPIRLHRAGGYGALAGLGAYGGKKLMSAVTGSRRILLAKRSKSSKRLSSPSLRRRSSST